MSLLTKVIPQGLNYSDIKPESIDTEIKLVKYMPTSTVNDVKRGEIIKFLVSGLGFLDPYSTFLKFRVRAPNLGANEYRFLDRSAHSFISQIIIRSQGTEIERITDYDMMAAMVNDMIYSSEQNQIHSWEGFPTQQVQMPEPGYNFGFQALAITNGAGQVANYPREDGALFRAYDPARRTYHQLHHMGSTPILKRFVGEQAFYADKNFVYATVNNVPNQQAVSHMANLISGLAADDIATGANRLPHGLASDFVFLPNDQYPLDNGIVPLQQPPIFQNQTANTTALTPLDFYYHQNGFRQTSTYHNANGGLLDLQVGALPAAQRTTTWYGNDTMEFIIPLYSGILGVMMPDKKLLPLGLMPLEIEIYLNNDALYSNEANGSRDYIISDFNLYSHVIFFESDIHKQLEAQCAQHGIFLYCNSFVQAARHQIPTNNVPSTMAIQTNLKSMNSIHLLFTYNAFHTMPCARKLHFVSHNIKKLQIKNGTVMIPTYAIEGQAGTSRQGEHVPFMVELMKAYNKLHDPKTDGAIHPFNFCGDEYGGQMDPLFTQFTNKQRSSQSLACLVNKQANVGRCQYAITFEGEELGADKLMVTGRKVEYPFYVELFSDGKVSNRASYLTTFIRCDFIVYIRPDLQIVVLGK